MSKDDDTEIPIPGEPSGTPTPFIVIFGVEVVGRFATLEDAVAFTRKRLDRRYEIYRGNKKVWPR